MSVLVIGYKGFIGAHVYRAFQTHFGEARVEGCDWPDLIQGYKPRLGETLSTIVNLAAIGGVARAARMPEHVMTNNVAAAMAARRLANELGAHAIQISSFSVYGNASTPTREDHPLRPREVYGASKLAQELCWTGFERCNILRLSSVYGPGMKLDDPEATVIAQIANCVPERSGEEFQIYEDGKQVRDFVHVNDVVKAVLEATRNPRVPRVMNVCSQHPTTILEACIELGVDYRITRKERPGDMRECLGDASVFRALCGEPHPFTPRDILHGLT